MCSHHLPMMCSGKKLAGRPSVPCQMLTGFPTPWSKLSSPALTKHCPAVEQTLRLLANQTLGDLALGTQPVVNPFEKWDNAAKHDPQPTWVVPKY